MSSVPDPPPSSSASSFSVPSFSFPSSSLPCPIDPWDESAIIYPLQPVFPVVEQTIHPPLNTSDSSSSSRSIRYRSYSPLALPVSRPPPSFHSSPNWLDHELESLISSALQENHKQTESSLTKVKAKDLNWDLKRDLEVEMREITNKTRKAMRKIVKQKIKAEKKRRRENGENVAESEESEESQEEKENHKRLTINSE
jgi:hypothetical protein